LNHGALILRTEIIVILISWHKISPLIHWVSFNRVFLCLFLIRNSTIIIVIICVSPPSEERAWSLLIFGASLKQNHRLLILTRVLIIWLDCSVLNSLITKRFGFLFHYDLLDTTIYFPYFHWSLSDSYHNITIQWRRSFF
jgi:hypothetical protein